MQEHMLLHTRQSCIQNNKYKVPHKYSCSSWWWAHSRPKHVEIDNYTKNKYTKNELCTKLALFTGLYKDAQSTKRKTSVVFVRCHILSTFSSVTLYTFQSYSHLSMCTILRVTKELFFPFWWFHCPVYNQKSPWLAAIIQFRTLSWNIKILIAT
jgi:hypothetical protein